MPRIAMWWFLLNACNIAAPPSLSLLGEWFVKQFGFLVFISYIYFGFIVFFVVA
jgi:hypothetical protein